MDKEQKISAEAYKHYLLGYLFQVIRAGYVVNLVRDIDGNPGHLEVTIPGDVVLQVIIKTIPEEPGVPARTTM